jgi:hypothetical protein
VKSTDASELQRLDTLTINGISYWIDRIGPDDCGSCHLWLGNGQPRRKPPPIGGLMGIKGLEQVIANLNSLDRNMVPNASAWAINRVARTAVTAATRKVANETIAGITE